MNIAAIDKPKCTGCKMCADICPKQAISFETDHEGFWYPIVDQIKCNDCSLCEKKCPSLNTELNQIQNMPEVYALWSKDIHVRLSSTSGGVFYEAGKYFIKIGGVVAGSRYGEDWRSARHMIARNMDELELIKGSKYFQSDTNGIYSAIKKEADAGTPVLFCGTPCQTAALKVFLHKEYDNVFFMDFICRSINSPLAFKSYIDELEMEHGSSVKCVHLKNKKYGWRSLASKVVFENGEESIRDRTEDWWEKGFIYNDLYTRESCYQCQYRSIPRKTADITIGDFWGIKGKSMYDMFSGISVILLNSEKGIQLFDKFKDRFFVERKTLNDVMPGNPALLKSPVRTNRQDKFFEMIHSGVPFSKAVSTCIKLKKIKNWKPFLIEIIVEMKRLCYYLINRKVSIPKYIYYNYFCKNIVRKGAAKLVPYKNAILDLHRTSRIYLRGDTDMIIGANKLRGSKCETYVRLDPNAVWKCNHGGALFYNTTLEIKKNALLETGYFSANSGSVIIAAKHIEFGEDVMFGRNVMVYDSDFHPLRMGNETINQPQKVTIEDHVWLTNNVTVLKGVTIGRDSLITAMALIKKNVPEHSIISGRASGKPILMNASINWYRESISAKEDNPTVT